MTVSDESNSPTLGNLRVEEISRASVREKSIRHGHISTLQFWWARRPLATCRSVIFAALRPRDAAGIPPALVEELRKYFPDERDDNSRLDALGGALAAWEAAENKKLLGLARSILQVGRTTTPVVFDPFAGGGSIPVEAQRLGLEAVAGELHPVAAAALRLAVEKLPASTDVVKNYLVAADQVADLLNSACSELYPADETPLAYLWCRTYRCPSCATESPLLRNRYLAQLPRRAVVTLSIAEQGINYRVVNDATKAQLNEASNGTVSERGAKCARCGEFVNAEFLRKEGQTGRLGEILYAVHEMLPNGTRRYRDPSKDDFEALRVLPDPEDVPSVDLDWNGVRHLWALQYGILCTRDLHSLRQQHALKALVAAVRQVVDGLSVRSEVAEAVALLLAVTVNRMVMYGNRHVWWQSNGEFPANIFVRQAISMVWSFVEMPVTSPGAAGWHSAVAWVGKAAEHLERLPVKGRLIFGDAASVDLDDDTVDLVFSDPPYYDSITYAYLADVFLPWTRAVLDGHVNGALADLPVHRSEEAIVDRPHTQAPSPKGDAHFRAKMKAAFAEMRRVVKPAGSVVLMYGHKKPTAWAAFLEPLLEAGLMPVETWPIHTERKAKFNHNKIGALSTSCILVCRPWELTERTDCKTLAELSDELYAAVVSQIDRFEGFGMDGADLSAALLAPIVAEWCRYKVTDGSGKVVPLSLLFEHIGEWSQAFQRRYLIERLQNKFGHEWVDAHLCAEGFRQGADTLPAVRYSRALSAGDAALADQIATGTDKISLGAGLRLLALATYTTSDIQKGALAGIGRLAMQGRGELPGSAPD